MAFFIPFTVECDHCKKEKTMKASSKSDMNNRLINYIDEKWFADCDSHFCGECADNWPYTQDSNGDNVLK